MTGLNAYKSLSGLISLSFMLCLLLPVTHEKDAIENFKGVQRGVEMQDTILMLNKFMPCDLVRQCVCMFATGQGIDLSLLNTTLMFNSSANNITYYFNPCGTVQLGNCPDGTSLCEVNHSSNQSKSIWKQSDASFVTQNVGDPVLLRFVDGTVDLKCESVNTTLQPGPDGIGGQDGKPYHFVLQSPNSCLRDVRVEHMSTGSLLVILFLVFGSTYLLLGSVANHLLRGATGWEMIPNHDFWKDLPNLCADGFKFALNGCRPLPSYEQI